MRAKRGNCRGRTCRKAGSLEQPAPPFFMKTSSGKIKVLCGTAPHLMMEVVKVCPTENIESHNADHIL